MEMKKCKLSEIASFIGSGMTPLRSNENYWNSKDYPWLKTEQLGEYQIFDTNEYISKVALEETNLKLFPKNTLSVAMYGEGKTRGNVSILAEQMTTNQACCNIIVDNKFANYKFVYYWLKNSYYKLRSLSSGVRNNLNSEDIKKFEINLPSLPTQQKIAAILSSLDDKIALNKKINAKLEAMAKRLYDYWFVQFDFPNEEGKPYKTSGGKMVWNEVLKRKIPEGLEVKSINEVCDVIDCLHSKKPDFCYEDEDSYLLSLENITKEGYIDISEKYYISKKDFSEWTSRICVKENDFLFTNAGRAGDMGMIPNGIKCAIGRNITAVRSKKINPYYLRCFFKSLYMKEQILNNLDKGCFFMSFNVRSIKQLSILIPKEENFHKFISFCEPIIKQLNKNNSEIQKLTNLRDRLLPLLMNGQVEVK